MKKTEFLQSVRREFHIIKLIHSQLEAKDLAYRPSANQRSIEELLRYLSYCAYESVKRILEGADYSESESKRMAGAFPIEEFIERINVQYETIREAIEGLPDETWSQGEAEYGGAGKPPSKP